MRHLPYHGRCVLEMGYMRLSGLFHVFPVHASSVDCCRLAGNFGFDPANLGTNDEALAW